MTIWCSKYISLEHLLIESFDLTLFLHDLLIVLKIIHKIPMLNKQFPSWYEGILNISTDSITENNFHHFDILCIAFETIWELHEKALNYKGLKSNFPKN